jgi:hypothetical protein
MISINTLLETGTRVAQLRLMHAQTYFPGELLDQTYLLVSFLLITHLI